MSKDDFYLLVPEDEWVEEQLSRRRSWDDRDEFEQQSHSPTTGPSADAWWYLWTGVALVLWTVFCGFGWVRFGRWWTRSRDAHLVALA